MARKYQLAVCYHNWSGEGGYCVKCGNIASEPEITLKNNDPETLEWKYDEFLGRYTFFKKLASLRDKTK